MASSKSSSSPMVEALKKGTIKAFGTSYFTKINEQNQKKNDIAKQESSIPFPSLVNDDTIGNENHMNQENNLRQFEKEMTKVTNEQVDCKSPEVVVKEKRRRRATMFVKGSSTPDDVKSPSFKTYDSDELLHKKRIEFSNYENKHSSSIQLNGDNLKSTTISTLSTTITTTNANNTSIAIKEEIESNAKTSSTTTLMDSETLNKELLKYQKENILLKEKANQSNENYVMALAEHDSLHFMNEVSFKIYNFICIYYILS